MTPQPSTPQPEPSLGSGVMFDAIARRYDLLNRVLSFGMDRYWRRRTVRALQLPAGAQVLDVATGTGDLALQLTHSVPDVAVVGLDPSRQMLELAEQKLSRKQRHSQVQLRQGDAEALPFADHSFDAITVAFGIRNVRDRLHALREMRRVTRPQGRIAILELGTPHRGWFQALGRFYLQHCVPRIGAWLSGAREYRYLERSVTAFPDANTFCAMMQQAGLQAEAPHFFSFGACTLFLATPDASPRQGPG